MNQHVKKKAGIWHSCLVYINVPAVPSIPYHDGTPIMTPSNKEPVKGLLMVKHHAVVGDSCMFYLILFNP
jgi:hypothetical protein